MQPEADRGRPRSLRRVVLTVVSRRRSRRMLAFGEVVAQRGLRSGALLRFGAEGRDVCVMRGWKLGRLTRPGISDRTPRLIEFRLHVDRREQTHDRNDVQYEEKRPAATRNTTRPLCPFHAPADLPDGHKRRDDHKSTNGDGEHARARALAKIDPVSVTDISHFAVDEVPPEHVVDPERDQRKTKHTPGVAHLREPGSGSDLYRLSHRPRASSRAVVERLAASPIDHPDQAQIHSAPRCHGLSPHRLDHSLLAPKTIRPQEAVITQSG